MFGPRAAYRRLLAEPAPVGPLAVLRRPALAALVIGGAIALTSTGGARPQALATTTLCWCFVPGVQLLVGAALLAIWRRPGLRLGVAIDLLFAGQGPWLLWTLGVAASALVAFRLGSHTTPRLLFVLLYALLPLGWTAIILVAFCREVLGFDGPRALVWMSIYQLAIWGLAYLYAGGMTFQAWPFGQMRL